MASRMTFQATLSSFQGWAQFLTCFKNIHVRKIAVNFNVSKKCQGVS